MFSVLVLIFLQFILFTRSGIDMEQRNQRVNEIIVQQSRDVVFTGKNIKKVLISIFCLH